MDRHSQITKKTIGVRGENLVFTIALPSKAKRVSKIIVTTKLTGSNMPVNRHYYGSATVPGVYNSAFINALQNQQMESTVKVFPTVNVPVGEKYYYARPARLDGLPAFEINSASVGFSNPIVVSVTDPETGYIENYHLFESDDSGIGSAILYTY